MTTPLFRLRHSGGAHISWSIWLERVFLALGAALFLAGIIYFFAFNWNRVPPFARFAIVEGGFALCLAGAVLLRGTRLFASGVALLAAGVLAGVFWAVFGQIYQTGADAWQLFALWALCLAPWVILGRTTALWNTWLMVANLALVLWILQTSGFSDFDDEYDSLLVPLMALNAAAALGCLLLGGIGKKFSAGLERRLLLPLIFLMGTATLSLCQNLLNTIQWHYATALPLPHLLPGLLALGLTLGAALRARLAPALYLLALCGFPLLNCLLLKLIPDGILGILTLFALGNLGYAALLAKTLPSANLSAGLPGRLRRRPASGISGFPGVPPAEDFAAELAAASRPPSESAPRPMPPTPLIEDAAASARTPPSPTDALSRENAQSPGYQIVMGLAALLTALCLVLLSSYIAFFNAGAEKGALYAMGILFAGGGVALARLGRMGRQNAFRRALSFSLVAGGCMFLVAAFLINDGLSAASVGFALVTVALYALYPLTPSRFLTVGTSLFLLAAALLDGRGYALPAGESVAFLCLLIACGLPLLWLAAGKKIPDFLWPAAWAALIFFIAYFPAWSPLYGTHLLLNLHNAPMGHMAITALPALGLVLLMLRQGRGRLAWLHMGALLAGIAAIWALGPHEALLALLLLALGHAFSMQVFSVLGAALLGVFLVAYYYFLDLSLLAKSASMSLAGLVLLLGAGLEAWRSARPMADRPSAVPEGEASGPQAQRGIGFRLSAWSAAVLAVGALTLGAFQYAIIGKERLLASGEELLLALAPRDPLSLMQGEYMELSYDLAWQGLAEYGGRRDGYAVLRASPLPNGRRVGEWIGVRAELPEDLPDGVFAVKFRAREYGGTKLFLPPHFLFQQGHAELYENARYAVLRCGTEPGSPCLLTGLADESGETIRAGE